MLRNFFGTGHRLLQPAQAGKQPAGKNWGAILGCNFFDFLLTQLSVHGFSSLEADQEKRGRGKAT